MTSPSEQALASWPPGERVSSAPTLLRRASRTVFAGSVIMLAGSAFVSLANFGYNIGVAHLLGPSDFSHAAAAVTLLMLASCINLAFQLVSAKLIARNELPTARAAVYQTMMRRAWFVGALLTMSMFAARSLLSSYLRLPETSLVDVLALGMLFYIPLGVRRGAMQGRCQFVRLSVNLTAEAVVKLIGAIAFILFGAGVFGAVGAISLSVFAAFLLPAGDAELRKRPHDDSDQNTFDASLLEGIQAIIFFVGQVIINNVDILMVKHYFASSEAGIYAAVALVGRLLYFATWSVTSAMFPVAAGARVEHESRRVLLVPLCFVLAISSIFVVILAAFPQIVIRVLFGSGFHIPDVNMGQLLMMNAVATGIYALAVVLITYEMSRRIANTGWFQLVVSGAIIAGVVVFHGSLLQVIVVQQVLRLVLLLAVSIPFIFGHARRLGQEAA